MSKINLFTISPNREIEEEKKKERTTADEEQTKIKESLEGSLRCEKTFFWDHNLIARRIQGVLFPMHKPRIRPKTTNNANLYVNTYIINS